MLIRRCIVFAIITVVSATAACSGPPAAVGPNPSEATLDTLTQQILEDFYKRQPTSATDLGIHSHDAELEDYSRAGVDNDLAALRQFRTQLAAIDPTSLSQGPQLDRELLLHTI